MRSSSVLRGRRRRSLVTLLLLTLSLGLIGTVPPQQAHGATCPCTVFTSAQAPTNPSANDPDAVELGMKFRSEQAGFVRGVRFYKGSGNTGTHTGSLWNAAGTRLASVTFSGETASGWQQATFAAPVAVAAGTTYVVSYYAPSGHYAGDTGYFSSAAVVRSPLTALQNGTDGGNGVYRYGTGGGFPNSTFQSTNYWVDVVFSTAGTDTTKPTVIDKQPASSSTGVPVTSGASATFSEAVQPSTIVMTLTGPSAVAATTAYDAGTRVVTLTPSTALAISTTYTVRLSGAKDAAGNTMDPLTWTFTTAASATGCPCSIWASTTTPATAAVNDSSAVEVGVKLRASRAGSITGIRFYKGTGNSGTHVGSLWTRTGTRLAEVTFSGETATGWQTATFASPVPVAAGNTYVASYHAPVGRYAVNGSYFAGGATTRGPLTALADQTDGPNGVYLYGGGGFPTNSFEATNYWVDVVFSTTATDTVAPTVASRAPAAGSSGASTTAPITAGFSEPVSASSVSIVVKAGASTVPGTVTYDAPSQSASFTPSSALGTSRQYSVTVSGAKDTANNVMAPDTWSFTTAAPPPPPPDRGPGGPVAVVTSSADPYSKYLAEILRTEGLNEFTTIDVGTLSASTLAGYDVVVLGSVSVSTGQAAVLTTWVSGGGNLVAMKPGPTLSSLLGITGAGGPLTDAYLKVDPATPPGAGIVSSTIQFHGPADSYALAGATAVATLYSNATTATTNPAVTLRNVGTSGGQAAAFTFDLPRSIALTRQGNPAWAGTERDGQTPIRSDDLFFGGSGTSWVDFAKVAVPQADEQQRLLTNLIQVMNRDKKPLPRFWYFPKRGDTASGAPNVLKAVLVGTGDDHGHNGTAGRFDQLLANSPAGCSVAAWTCYRYSSYLYPSTPLSSAAAKSYSDQGFEVGVHESTDCGNYTAASVASTYATDIADFKANFPSLPNAVSTRMHCVAFSDWASQPKVETGYGIRTDTNYYYWPGTWVQDRPGFMTGSGMPMRFTDTDGTMIDSYQAATQMSDESGQTFPFTIDTLLNNAQGATGYFGAFVANFHTDLATEPQSDALLASAKSHHVPIISGKQLSTWLDGRNGSAYRNLSWSGSTLSFSVSVGAGATGLTGMLPTAGPNGTQLTGITRAGTTVPYATTTVKGLDYAAFDAGAGSYHATYGAGTRLSVLSAVKASAAQLGPIGASDLTPAAAPERTTTARTTTTDQTASVTWRTSIAATSRVLIGTAPGDLEPAATEAGATTRHSIAVTGLKARTTYYYRVVSADTTGQEVVSPDPSTPPLTLTTAANDLAAPVASRPVVTPLPDGTATISWRTDGPAVGGVRVGARTRTIERQMSMAPTIEHSVVLADLKPGQTYVIRTVSQDRAGNRTVSKPVRFITPAVGVGQQTAESFKLGTVRGDGAISDRVGDGVTLAGATRAARGGGYTSGVLDAHQLVDWDRATVSAQVPKGSKSRVRVRLGTTAVPDGTWTAWTALPDSGRVRGSSRYLQYQITMSAAAGAAAPTLSSIGFSHNGAALDPESETG